MGRCEFTHSNGQCSETAIEGDKYCSLHVALDTDKHQKRLYNLLKSKYRIRYEQISDHESLRSLRDEVAIAKMVLEETLNNIQNDSEMIASRADIAHQATTIERLVASMVKMESSLGQLITKPTLLKIAADIVKILIEKLKDVPNHDLLIDDISAAIIDTITNVKENIE